MNGKQSLWFLHALDSDGAAYNVASAVRLARPAIVDVSSGVERAPGIKDAELIRLFIQHAKTAK